MNVGEHVQLPQLSVGALGSAVLTATETAAKAEQVNEQDTYNDRSCQQQASSAISAQAQDAKAAYGCGCRKRTVMLEGDIVYAAQSFSTEAGSAAQAEKGCECATSTTTTSLTSGSPLGAGCVAVSACLPA